MSNPNRVDGTAAAGRPSDYEASSLMDEQAEQPGTDNVAVWLTRGLFGAIALVVGLGIVVLVAYQRQQPKSTSLFTAAVHYPDDIPKLIRQGHDVNERRPGDATPLTYAVIFRKVESVRKLLDAGANPNFPGQNDDPPLLASAMSFGRPEAIQMTAMLLQHGADPNVHSKTHNDTPLHRAVNFGDRGVVQLLLAHKADPNVRRIYDETPLHIAAREGRADLAVLLIHAGADVDAPNHHENSPLHIAVAAAIIPSSRHSFRQVRRKR